MSDLLTRAAVDAVINALLNNSVPDESIEPDEHNQMLKDILDTLTGLDKTLRYQNETLGYNLIVSDTDQIQYQNSGFAVGIYSDTLTANRTQTHQDKDGVIALLSDITGLGDNWANQDLILTADRTHNFDDFGIQQNNVSFVNWDNATAGSFFNLDLTLSGVGFNAYLVGGTALTAYNMAFHGYTFNGGGVGGTFDNSLNGTTGTFRVTPGGGSTAGLFLDDNKFRTRGYVTFESKETQSDAKLSSDLSYYLYATSGVLHGRYRQTGGGITDILFDSTKVEPGTNGNVFKTVGGVSAWGDLTLQDAYDVSTQPQILTSVANGGFIIRNGQALDTNTVFELQNIAGTPTFTVGGNGIVANGNWQASTISAAFGGTGQSVYTIGDLLYASNTTALGKLGIGLTGQVLTVSGGLPIWSTPTSGTVTGSGTTNYLARWTSSTALGVGILQDNGTTSGNSLNANYTFNMEANNFAVGHFKNTRTTTGSAYGIYAEAVGANAAASNIAIYGLANSASGGQNYAVQGDFDGVSLLGSSFFISGTGTGTGALFRAANSSGTTYGMIGAAASVASQASATFVGGYFHAQNGGTANYSLKLVDGTEGAGKFLKSITAGGLANWANISYTDLSAMTSAQFATLISDETGTGKVVFSTSPSFTTPSLGVATATSINGNIFSGAINSTWNLSNNKTFTVSSSLAFSGTDGTTFTFPSTTGTVVTLAEVQTLTNKTLTTPNIASIKGTLTTDTDGATVTFDKNASDFHQVTLGGNRTFALSNMAAGDRITLMIIQDGTGSRTVTWFGTIKWVAGTVPTLTTTANKTDVVSFFCTSAGNYLGFVIGKNL